MVNFAPNMENMYDIRVRTVRDYNDFMGAESIHPQVSVLHYDDLPPIRHCRCLWGVYGLFLLNDNSELLGYGTGIYDYSIGSIVCVSPSQIGGVPDDGTTFTRKGWALLFDPELFHGTDFEKKLRQMEFFHYHINVALAVTWQEQQNYETLLRLLQTELAGERRKDIIIRFIELILAYCSSFFNRQYSIENGMKRRHIVSRLEHLLDDYYASGEQNFNGLPTVRACAEKLCVAPNYLGDLIREETGDSANHFIGRYIIRTAKNMMMSGKSVTETAYALGFDYPSHLSRLFNRLEGRTPSAYLKQNDRRKT